MDVLRTSFDGLEIDEKEIFLHIACFFNWERCFSNVEDYVKRILDCCELHPHIGIKVLHEKSLITIRNQKIHMHDMMQELGKQIVRGEFPKDPRTWSRLWRYQDFHLALTSGMEAYQTKAIVMDLKEDVSKYGRLQIGELSKMRGLELLILYDMNCSGGLSLPDSLRFLSWHGCPFTCLPLDFQPKKLVELNMSYSNIKRLWEGFKGLPSLKRMDLSNSEYLMETPNFEGIPNLERLDLRGCRNLTKVHPSIGLLENLAFLNLENCSNLVSLNLGSVSNLCSLRVLHLSSCTNLEKTPDFTGMPNLEDLDLELCKSLSTIHESIGALVNLKFLSLKCCTNLVEIPDSINALGSLITLDLRYCLKLKNLSLGVRLKDCLAISRYVPSSCLGSLIFLNLGFCNMHEVPNAIADLKSLERLNLQGNHFGSLPDTISLLCSLAYLNLAHCHELQSLPLLPSINASLVGRYFETVPGAHYNQSGLYIFNCPKLVESKYSQVCASKLALEWLTILIEEPRHFRCGFDIIIPGRVIPEWFEMPHGFNREQNVGSKYIWLIYISRPHCHLMETGAHVTFKARSGLEIRRWGLRMIYKQGTVAMNRDLNYEEEPPRELRKTSIRFYKLYLNIIVKEENIENIEEPQRELRKTGIPFCKRYRNITSEEEDIENIEADKIMRIFNDLKENDLDNIGLAALASHRQSTCHLP